MVRISAGSRQPRVNDGKKSGQEKSSLIQVIGGPQLPVFEWLAGFYITVDLYEVSTPPTRATPGQPTQNFDGLSKFRQIPASLWPKLRSNTLPKCRVDQLTASPLEQILK